MNFRVLVVGATGSIAFVGAAANSREKEEISLQDTFRLIYRLVL